MDRDELFDYPSFEQAVAITVPRMLCEVCATENKMDTRFKSFFASEGCRCVCCGSADVATFRVPEEVTL
jgi:hypothetical protein